MSAGYVHGFELDPNHSLHIYQGSLVEVQADALVSSDDSHLTASGGVARALRQQAGIDVRRECDQIAQERHLTVGDVVSTAPGRLPCHHLYHAITIDFDRRLFIDESNLRRL